MSYNSKIICFNFFSSQRRSTQAPTPRNLSIGTTAAANEPSQPLGFIDTQ